MTTQIGIEHIGSMPDVFDNTLDGLLAAGEAPMTTTGNITPSPLFLAEVDEVDTSAVLALLAVVPTDDGAGLRVFERRDGGWQEVPDYVQKFKSISPPTVVELDRDTLIAVVDQLDTSDAGKGKEGAPSPAEPSPEPEPGAAAAAEPYPVEEQSIEEVPA